MKSRLLIVILGVALGLAAKAVFGPPKHNRSADPGMPLRSQRPSAPEDPAPREPETPRLDADDEEDLHRFI